MAAGSACNVLLISNDKSGQCSVLSRSVSRKASITVRIDRMSELLQSAVKVTCDGTTLADFGEESIQPKVITVPSPQAAAPAGCRRNRFCRGQQGVCTHIYRCRTGVIGPSSDQDVIAFQADNRIDDTDIFLILFKDGALFNMQLNKNGDILRLFPGAFYSSGFKP